jgi:hypothetical protein
MHIKKFVKDVVTYVKKENVIVEIQVHRPLQQAFKLIIQNEKNKPSTHKKKMDRILSIKNTKRDKKQKKYRTRLFKKDRKTLDKCCNCQSEWFYFYNICNGRAGTDCKAYKMTCIECKNMKKKIECHCKPNLQTITEKEN